jgi:hypothetical protein
MQEHVQQLMARMCCTRISAVYGEAMLNELRERAPVPVDGLEELFLN